MPKQPKEKSPHLQGLEAVFERHTRRFSPFDILGLRTSEGDSPELERTKTDQEEIPTHMGVDATHPHVSDTAVQPPATSAEVGTHDVLAATQVRAQLGRKARQVLGYLNSIRSLERPAYTVPVGYAQISAAADVHAHYLRRNVLPKLAMM